MKFASIIAAIVVLFSITISEAKMNLLPNGILDVNDIIRMIDTTMPHWKQDPQWNGTMWLDRYYRRTTVPEMIQYTKVASRAANQLPWNGEAGDCDSAAIVFKASLVKQAVKKGGENPIPAGIMIMADSNRNFAHAMMWFVDDELELWLIEPRGGLMKHWKEFPGLRVFWIMG